MPSIDPLLSNRKMYYPLLASKSTSLFLPSLACWKASSKSSYVNLGMNDITAVVLLSEWDKRYEGF